MRHDLRLFLAAGKGAGFIHSSPAFALPIFRPRGLLVQFRVKCLQRCCMTRAGVFSSTREGGVSLEGVRDEAHDRVPEDRRPDRGRLGNRARIARKTAKRWFNERPVCRLR